jgi:hypothetical protein
VAGRLAVLAVMLTFSGAGTMAESLCSRRMGCQALWIAGGDAVRCGGVGSTGEALGEDV